MPKRFVTQYALSKGIEELEGDIDRQGDLRVKDSHYTRYIPSRSHHATLEEAKAKAEAMRQTKIASLRKQLTAVESLTWTPKMAKSAAAHSLKEGA